MVFAAAPLSPPPVQLRFTNASLSVADQPSTTSAPRVHRLPLLFLFRSLPSTPAVTFVYLHPSKLAFSHLLNLRPPPPPLLRSLLPMLKRVTVVWTFLNVCLLAAGGLSIAFSILWRKPDLLMNITISSMDLNGELSSVVPSASPSRALP